MSSRVVRYVFTAERAAGLVCSVRISGSEVGKIQGLPSTGFVSWKVDKASRPKVKVASLPAIIRRELEKDLGEEEALCVAGELAKAWQQASEAFAKERAANAKAEASTHGNFAHWQKLRAAVNKFSGQQPPARTKDSPPLRNFAVEPAVELLTNHTPAAVVNYPWALFFVDEKMVSIRTTCCDNSFYEGPGGSEANFIEGFCLGCDELTGLGFLVDCEHGSDWPWGAVLDELVVAFSRGTAVLEATLDAGLVKAKLEEALEQAKEQTL